MIPLKLVRRLDITRPSYSQRPSYFGAASGIARHREHFLVIADDELSAGYFFIKGSAPGELISLRAGELPADKESRKKIKPDFEAITEFEESRYLILPSGSKANRVHGHLLDLSSGKPEVEDLDFTKLFAKLSEEFEELNLEGASCLGPNLVLAHRGNKDGKNALITLPLEKTSMSFSAEYVSDLVSDIHEIELPRLDGWPLAITDLCAHDGELYFTAASERTSNAYDDGEIVGSAVGKIDLRDYSVPKCVELEGQHKIEGLIFFEDECFVVSDPDDPSTASTLFSFDPRHLR